jgi:sulfate permease, SulP family
MINLNPLTWLRHVPSARWLAEYRATWLAGDIVAGVTLAAYAIPVSLAYAGLAGLPPQVGIYGYLLGGLGYALLAELACASCSCRAYFRHALDEA